MTNIIIYTDGACSGNPGPGGWCAIIQDQNSAEERVLQGGAALTTNNRMELEGAINGLQAITDPLAKISLYTDSKYVQQGMTEWLANWKKKGWKNAQNKPVKNQDLWQKMDELCSSRQVDWHWVKGHSTNEHNQRADLLAVRALEKYR